MLTVSAKDSDNRIVHVATLSAGKENTSNYAFLLEPCKKNV